MYALYQARLKEYQAKYGLKTTIFLQVGSFYELYEIQNPETGETASNTKEVADSIDLQFAVHKGEAPDNRDGLVAGFPDYALHKWAAKLTSQGYTVVVIDQIKNSRGQVTDRKVTRILSPSTHIETIPSATVPYTTVIYFDATSIQSPPSYGVASLDLTTGKTTTFTGIAQGRPDAWTADALVQNLTIFLPREIVIYWYATIPPPKNLQQILSISPQTTTLIHEITSIGTFANSATSAEYLRRIFNIRSLLPSHIYLNLSDLLAPDAIALLYLIQFIEEHMPSTAATLTKNTPWQPEQQLICGNHALTQLQITSQAVATSAHNQPDCLLSLFTATATPMGKRAVAARILRPLTDPVQISSRLDQVASFISLSPAERKQIITPLRLCRDLPRLHRKIQTATIDPSDFSAIQQTYSAVEQLLQCQVIPTNLLPTITSTHEPFNQRWKEYIAKWTAVIDKEKVYTFLQSREDETPYTAIAFPELAEVERNIQATINAFETERKQVARTARLSDDSLRLEAREKEPFGIKATKAQMAAAKLNLTSLPKGTVLTELKSNGWIDTPTLSTLNRQLIQQRQELASKQRTALLTFCQQLTEVGSATNIWSETEDWLGLLDVTQTLATTAELRGFVRPTIEGIQQNQTQTSHLSIEGLRHPLVEATNSRSEYVQHNIELGAQTNGMLIYGMNASGKSTLMKAVGIAVLLAQAGSYVPARKMTLRPFTAIYTRILNQDNIFAGLSSFAVEISELRDILRAADSRSLVLGDELCAGTESTSAEALVAAGIRWLANRNAKFIFATHLHHLPTLLDTSTLRLGIYHIHVSYDPITQKLIYDRELRPGPGTSLYGLEVARAMDLPLAFIDDAIQNRHKILGTVRQEDAPISTYNASIIRRQCEICNRTTSAELEVHHIEPQRIANDGLLPNGKPLNSAANLITVCAECHDKHHAGQLQIHPLIVTSDGLERTTTLSTASPERQQVNRSKWSDEEKETIINILNKYNQLSLKAIQGYLKNNFNITISATTLGNFRKEIN